MVMSAPPDDCPCGRGGVHLLEAPTLYVHQFVTHRVRLSGDVWAVEADLPHVRSLSEAAHDWERQAWAIDAFEAAKTEWQKYLAVTTGPLRKLLEMHEPWLTPYRLVLCDSCMHSDDRDEAEWPCMHWDLLTQLVP